MTRRWPGLLLLDIRLQIRNGFYAAVALVALGLAAGSVLLQYELLRYLLPMLFFSSFVMNGFFFMSALVLFEKAEKTPLALAVSPIRPAEYLAAKLLSLVLLSCAEALVIIVAIGVPANELPQLLLGAAVMTAMLALAGFIMVARHNQINSFLLPSVFAIMLLSLPMIGYLLDWQSQLLWLHPMQPAFALFKPWSEISGAEIAIQNFAAGIWLIIAFRLSLRRFGSFIERTWQVQLP